jgi:hypothetical protein
MKGFVELSEIESREVKGGAFDFSALLNGIISFVSNLIPTIQSLLSGLFGTISS